MMLHRNRCLCLLPLLLACAQPSDDDADADAGVDTVEDLVDLPPDVPPDVPPDRPDAADDGPDISSVLIYAHSADTLYSFSAYTLTVTEIGPFELPDGTPAPFMFDLAVNLAGDVYTSSDTSLYRCDPATARVTLVGEFGLAADEELYALTFLPEGVLRSDRETMIGATNAGAYYEVDVATAEASYLGQYPDGWLSSGDIVSIVGLGTYATLKRYDYPCDVLAEMTFRSDGSVSARVIGPIDNPEGEQFSELFGLGYWGRSLYGFSNSGQLVEINRNTALGTLVATATGTDQFWGAGVTTIAPIIF
jgi:hypothetical protein